MVAGIFPGQGSQKVGMGKYLFDNFRTAKLLLEEASDSVNINFKKLLFNGPEEDLRLTQNTQPAIVLCSIMAYKCLREESGLDIAVASGHSVGEYSALTAANCFNFSDAIKAVKQRGLYMQNSVPEGPGGMSAVMGLTQLQTQVLCDHATKKTDQIVEIANINAPGQIVISGNKKALDFLATQDLKSLFKDSSQPPKRIKLIALKVSAPFHCSMMKQAAEEMHLTLESINLNGPDFEVIQNVTASSNNSEKEIKKALVNQISGSVLWIDCVAEMSKKSQNFIEFGNGSVLKGLLKKINPELKVYNLNSLEEFKETAKLF